MRHLRLSALFLLIWLSATISLKAQDDLLNMLESEIAPKDEKEFVYATFKTTRIINGQSVENTAGGTLNFIIGHRFGKINDGAYEFFGLDQATIRLGLEYGITDWLNVGLGRSSFLKTTDSYLKIKALRQSKAFPFTATLFSSVAANGMKWSEPERENYYSSRLSFAYQLLMARKFSNAFSLQITPSMVHRNLVETTDDDNDVFAVGFGGRIKISNRVSINGEYFYQLPGTKVNNTYDAVALGVDIETGGHVFQFQVTNSKGLIEQYFIPMTTGNILDGDIYFGFNINRVFTVGKKKKSD
jgi:hypothetical protein